MEATNGKKDGWGRNISKDNLPASFRLILRDEDRRDNSPPSPPPLSSSLLCVQLMATRYVKETQPQISSASR